MSLREGVRFSFVLSLARSLTLMTWRLFQDRRVSSRMGGDVSSPVCSRCVLRFYCNFWLSGHTCRSRGRKTVSCFAMWRKCVNGISVLAILKGCETMHLVTLKACWLGRSVKCESLSRCRHWTGQGFCSKCQEILGSAAAKDWSIADN